MPRQLERRGSWPCAPSALRRPAARGATVIQSDLPEGRPCRLSRSTLPAACREAIPGQCRRCRSAALSCMPSRTRSPEIPASEQERCSLPASSRIRPPVSALVDPDPPRGARPLRNQHFRPPPRGSHTSPWSTVELQSVSNRPPAATAHQPKRRRHPRILTRRGSLDPRTRPTAKASLELHRNLDPTRYAQITRWVGAPLAKADGFDPGDATPCLRRLRRCPASVLPVRNIG